MKAALSTSAIAFNPHILLESGASGQPRRLVGGDFFYHNESVVRCYTERTLDLQI